MKRFKIYMNDKYMESYSKLSEAEARVRIYERHDRYERDVEGYTNPPPTYEIRKYITGRGNPPKFIKWRL